MLREKETNSLGLLCVVCMVPWVISTAAATTQNMRSHYWLLVDLTPTSRPKEIRSIPFVNWTIDTLFLVVCHWKSCSNHAHIYYYYYYYIVLLSYSHLPLLPSCFSSSTYHINLADRSDSHEPSAMTGLDKEIWINIHHQSSIRAVVPAREMPEQGKRLSQTDTGFPCLLTPLQTCRLHCPLWPVVALCACFHMEKQCAFIDCFSRLERCSSDTFFQHWWLLSA